MWKSSSTPWVKLKRYVDDGHLFIDDNRVERTIK
ncbi:IS66 family transposase [Vibrio parahaemolyticus]